MRAARRIRLLLTFVAGGGVAALVAGLAGGVGSLAATRYGDLTESQHRSRERDLEGHLTQGDAEPQSGADEESPEAPEAPEADLQLDRALEILKSWSYFERLKRDRETGFLQARASETAP